MPPRVLARGQNPGGQKKQNVPYILLEKEKVQIYHSLFYMTGKQNMIAHML